MHSSNKKSFVPSGQNKNTNIFVKHSPVVIKSFQVANPTGIDGSRNSVSERPEFKRKAVHNLNSVPIPARLKDTYSGPERRSSTSSFVTKERRRDGYFPETVDFAERAEKARLSMQRQPHVLQQMLFPEAAQQWLEYKSLSSPSGRSRFVSRRSVDDLKQYIKALTLMFKRERLADIHIGFVREYQLARSSGDLTGTKKEVGPNKINQEVGALIRILKYAQCWTPEHEELYMPLQREESDIPKALSPSEQNRWLNIAESRPQWSFVYWYSLLGLDAPLSTNEARGSKIGDLDLHNNMLMVRVQNSKNKYRTRSIPLSDTARWAVDRLLERAAGAGATAPQQFLMPFRRKHVWFPDRPMTVSGIKRPWDEVRKAAGLEWFTPYGLRHTSITRYAEAGTPIAVLMSLAGHMSRKMQEHYTHISEQAKRKAVQNASFSVAQNGHRVSS